jgi:hypothetical protein
MCAGCDMAKAEPGSVHIDAKSTNRTVCQLAFAKIDNLVIDAKYVGKEKQRTRVNIERYSACPYDVEIKYAGLKMRLDFGTAISLNNVRSYDPVAPVNTGYFVYDGDAWQGTSDVIPDAETIIQVQSKERYELVTGVVHRQDPNSKVSDYCFALALVEAKGYATGGVCSRKKSDLLPLNELFKKEPLTLRQ